MGAAPGAVATPWIPGEIHAEILAACAIAALAYLLAIRAHGAPVSRSVRLRFFAGLVVVVLALNGPLHDLSDRYLFSAHMVQHLLLTLVVPPLLLTGTPTWMVDALLAPIVRRRGGTWLVRRMTHPVAAIAVYAVALIIWHLPAPYEAALEHHAWHIVEHLVLLAAAIIGWWPVLSPSALVPPLPYAAQILYLFVFGMPMTVVAAMITAAYGVLYPFYAAAPRVAMLTAIEDQRLGGILMWVPAGIIPLLAFTAVFFRWAAEEAEPLEDTAAGARVSPPSLRDCGPSSAAR